MAAASRRGRYGILRADTVELLRASGTQSYRAWQALALVIPMARERGRMRKDAREAVEAWAARYAPGVDASGLQAVSISNAQMMRAMRTSSSRAAQDAMRALVASGVLVEAKPGRKGSPAVYIVGPVPEAGGAGGGDFAPPP